jgi:hypothetical protein
LLLLLLLLLLSKCRTLMIMDVIIRTEVAEVPGSANTISTKPIQFRATTSATHSQDH